MKTGSRRAERTKSFQVLYALFFNQVDSRRALARFFQSYPDPDLPDVSSRTVEESKPAKGRGKKLPPPEQEPEQAMPSGFAWNLVEGVWRTREELDNIIEGLSSNWRLDRIGKVELTILRICVYELLYNTATPPKVVINEGIELSREFGDDNSRSFVNGILDAAVKAAEAGRLARTE